MLKRFALSALLVGLFMQLSACGFHLRGVGSTGALPFSTVHIQASEGVRIEVLQALKRQLNHAGVTLLDSVSAEAEIVLAATLSQTSRTASSGLGDATSELIKMTQPFSVSQLTTGDTLVSGSSTTYRDRQINTTAVLSSDSELRSIHKSMGEDLARQVLDRIRRAKPSKQTSP